MDDIPIATKPTICPISLIGKTLFYTLRYTVLNFKSDLTVDILHQLYFKLQAIHTVIL